MAVEEGNDRTAADGGGRTAVDGGRRQWRKEGSMREKNRTLPKPVGNNPIVLYQPEFCFEGENLAPFLKSIQREIESARALDTTLPPKFWLKQQFAVGVNEVTRVLERMPKIPPEEHFPSNHVDSRAPCVHLQAILIASNCNPRWLTKHLPALAASRNVPLIFIKDRKEGSLRLGELIKLKTAIAVGIKAKGNSINQLIKEVLVGDKVDSVEAEDLKLCSHT